MPSAVVEALLFNTDPGSFLPHRYPFLFLDRIVELEKGTYAVAQTLLSVTHGFSQMLLVESVAQLAGILTVQQEGEGGFLAAIDQAEFSNTACSGDILTVSARVLKAFGRLFLVEGLVSCGDILLLKVKLTLGVGQL
jgi:3-hydroxyacyl-[acyl-carrier-protein] dehydratase